MDEDEAFLDVAPGDMTAYADRAARGEGLTIDAADRNAVLDNLRILQGHADAVAAALRIADASVADILVEAG